MLPQLMRAAWARQAMLGNLIFLHPHRGQAAGRWSTTLAVLTAVTVASVLPNAARGTGAPMMASVASVQRVLLGSIVFLDSSPSRKIVQRVGAWTGSSLSHSGRALHLPVVAPVVVDVATVGMRAPWAGGGQAWSLGSSSVGSGRVQIGLHGVQDLALAVASAVGVMVYTL